MHDSTSRRTFLKASTAALAGSALPAAALPKARALGQQEISVALIGCGGRGSGAAMQALSTEGPVKLIAMADAFSDRLDTTLKAITKQKPDQVDVPEDRRFVGFDAYKHAIDSGADVIILTTPPGFRPMHFQYAVGKGKHVFMEKPVAVDGPGVRKVITAAQDASARNLKVGVGLQRHHSKKYQETIRRIHEGAIGDIVLLRSYWNSGGVWVYPRRPDQPEMEYQMRNWYYFNWLCGDHITEQHIHNLDVANWVMNGYPAEAQGQGGRQVRKGPEHGEIYDHHMVEFTYEGGAKLLSQCRHMRNTGSQVNEVAHGSLGTSNSGGGRIDIKDGESWRYRGEGNDAYQTEHDVLFAAIRNDTPHNEGENGAKSTLTSIMGRMATYSGKRVTWQEAMNSQLELIPTAYAWDGIPPSVPGPDGLYPIPMPGQTKAL